MTRRVRVLVVDDSAFMRGAIARVLSADPRLEVIGQAANGLEAVRLVAELGPDVVTMDFNMPGMNGAEATRAIMAHRATAIVMLSAHTREGAVATIEALGAGAVDFVTKPDGEVSVNLSAVREELVEKLFTAAKANLQPFSAVAAEPAAEPPISRRLRSVPRSMPPGMRVVVVAASTGGPAALLHVVPELIIAQHTALIIVQHMPAGFTRALAEQLAERAPFPVYEAQAGEELSAGIAVVAPGGRHLLIERGCIALSDAAAVHGVRPAADVTFKSVAQTFGARTVGVVLTGMGRDGALGLAAVRAAGGRTVAQDKGTSVVFGMPKAAIEMGVVEEVLPLVRVSSSVNKIIG